MLTQCPACQTRYEIEDRLLRRRGRRIRCATCDESWFQLPADSRKAVAVPEIRVTAPRASQMAPTVALVDVPLSPITASRVAAAARPRARQPMRLSAPLLRAAALAVLVTAGMSAVGFRERIVRIVPQAGVLYAAMGLPVNARGLEFRDVKSTILTDNGRRLLAVEGVIAQVGRHGAKVPDVRVAVNDPTGREIYSWTTPAPRQTLARGETALFRARLAAPPVAGAQIKVQFADASR
jgi:predicted Zn finger-like uncharacterized protein